MNTTLSVETEGTILSPEQKKWFDSDGFLIVEDALPPDMVERLLAVVDRLYEEGRRNDGLTKTHKWDLQNCIVHDDLFMELLTHPKPSPWSWICWAGISSQ